jgi:hypothetical protein
MNNKRILGTAAYLGIDEPLEKIATHLEKAAKAGLNAVFTSLHMPESKAEILKHDLPRFTEIAHSLGLLVDADISPNTMRWFGIDYTDPVALKSFGIDIARIDFGCTAEEIAKLTNNDKGLIIEINASHPAESLRGMFKKLESAGMNKQNIRACHNYYPKAYTGLTCEQVRSANSVIHEDGCRTAGFIPSLAHHRSACNDGLPTIERHRYMETHAVIQEMYLLGTDDIYFGDDFPSEEEMKALALSDPKIVELRIELINDSEEARWLLDREFHEFQIGLEHFLRFREKYPGPFQLSITRPRMCGDITIDNKGYGRYSGEVNIVKKDTPCEPRVNIIAKVIEGDRPVLELITG